MNDVNFKFSKQLDDSSIGSKELLDVFWKFKISNTGQIDEHVSDFVDYIWYETIGDLEKLFNIEFDETIQWFLKLEKVNFKTAESIVIQLK